MRPRNVRPRSQCPDCHTPASARVAPELLELVRDARPGTRLFSHRCAAEGCGRVYWIRARDINTAFVPVERRRVETDAAAGGLSENRGLPGEAGRRDSRLLKLYARCPECASPTEVRVRKDQVHRFENADPRERILSAVCGAAGCCVRYDLFAESLQRAFSGTKPQVR